MATTKKSSEEPPAGNQPKTPVQRALQHIHIASGGLESLGARIAGGRIGRADIEELVELIRQAPDDPLTLGLEATPDGANEAATRDRAKLVHDTRGALEALAEEGEASQLDSGQLFALEAIVRLTGRPSILIQNGTLDKIPAAWQPRLVPVLRDIEQTMKAVGRIQVDGYPELGYIGTGFLVGPKVLMTNEHVAAAFCSKTGSNWSIRSGVKASIDFRQEYGSNAVAAFPIKSVVGVHPKLDLALLEVGDRGTPGAKLAKPLRITRDVSKAARSSQIYVVGYPAADPRNDFSQQHRIFKGIFEKKRLAPGRIMKNGAARTITHDCTTLGGSSGSCVVELNTGKVVGLHFDGSYLKENTAVLLPVLERDPLILKAGIKYV
jgi:V8-like Glu-specific endopeptidase